MHNYLSTRQAAQRLKVKTTALSRAVWDGRIKPPMKSPQGSFLWAYEDLRRACWYFHRKDYTDSSGGVR